MSSGQLFTLTHSPRGSARHHIQTSVNPHSQAHTRFPSKWADTHCRAPHTHTCKLHSSHAPTSKTRPLASPPPKSPSCHTPKSPGAGQSHTVATGKAHASPFPTPPRLGAPRWVLHSVSGALPPGSPACVRGRSCSEARSRQRPARGWPRPRRLPIPAGPTPKVGDRPGGCGEWRLHGSVHALAAASSTRDQRETARDRALASPCTPAPGQAGPARGGWLTAGGGSLESLC